MPSFERSAGGSVFSSTPGPPLGDPLTATISVFPSGLTRTPRGRCPGSSVATTLSVFVSMTVTSLPSSFDTNRYGPPLVKSVCAGFGARRGRGVGRRRLFLAIACRPRRPRRSAPLCSTPHVRSPVIVRALLHRRQSHSPSRQRRRQRAVLQQLLVKRARVKTHPIAPCAHLHASARMSRRPTA